MEDVLEPDSESQSGREAVADAEVHSLTRARVPAYTRSRGEAPSRASEGKPPGVAGDVSCEEVPPEAERKAAAAEAQRVLRERVVPGGISLHQTFGHDGCLSSGGAEVCRIDPCSGGTVHRCAK